MGLPGTSYYKGPTECPPSKKCDKGCNYVGLSWCYVKRGCTGAAHFNSTVAGMPSDLAFSYEVCGNPYCWDPSSWDETKCPAGNGCEEMTCDAVKQAYKTQACCGAPTKKVKKSRFA